MLFTNTKKTSAIAEVFLVFVGMITGSSNYLADLNAVLFSKIFPTTKNV